MMGRWGGASLWKALATPVAAVCLAGCLTPFARTYPPAPADAVPPVVAVTSFENRSGFAGQWELGTGMADLLVSELVGSRHFVVVERGQLDRVVDEIERQRRRLFRPEGRVDEGRLRNAQYLIRGTINDFSQVGGAWITVLVRKLATLGAGGYRARVALTLTVMDVETGEVVDSVLCSGTAAAHEVAASGSYKQVAFGGDAFFKTPLGTATLRAIRDAVRELLRTVPRRAWQPMIATVGEGQVILNGGRARGFRTGALYEVRGDDQAVTDPATGEVLSRIPGPVVGTLSVTEVRETIAFARVVSGGNFKRGQRLIPLAAQSER